MSPRPDDVREVAASGLVKQLCCQGQLAGFEDADDYAAAAIASRATAFCAKFHAPLLFHKKPPNFDYPRYFSVS